MPPGTTYTMATQKQPQPQAPTPPPLSSFDSTDFPSSPSIYFYHEVDTYKASIHTHVLGPNVSFMFRHPRALGTRDVDRFLGRKTTGFLALVTPSGRRVVLAWAESGHGLHKSGELLAKDHHLLSNRTWARRVLRLSKVLGMNMGHPYDKTGREGAFRSSHVEVKLGAHAIYVLLTMFGIGRRGVTLESLRLLSSARWEDGSRPRFEIYFSKKNCNTCASFIKKLHEATGVEIRLVWGVRLEKMVYEKNSLPERPKNAEEQITAEATAARHASARTSQPVGNYINGLAYCIGQTDHEPPNVAMQAIVALARVYMRQHGRKERKRVVERVNAKVSKPLPATPETHAPMLPTPRTNGVRRARKMSWDMGEGAQKPLLI